MGAVGLDGKAPPLCEVGGGRDGGMGGGEAAIFPSKAEERSMAKRKETRWWGLADIRAPAVAQLPLRIQPSPQLQLALSLGLQPPPPSCLEGGAAAAQQSGAARPRCLGRKEVMRSNAWRGGGGTPTERRRAKAVVVAVFVVVFVVCDVNKLCCCRC